MRAALLVLLLWGVAWAAPGRHGVDPNEVLRLFREGQALYNAGDYAAAAGRFQMALRLNRDNAPARTWLGNAFFQMGRYSDARLQMEIALVLDYDGSCKPFAEETLARLPKGTKLPKPSAAWYEAVRAVLKDIALTRPDFDRIQRSREYLFQKFGGGVIIVRSRIDAMRARFGPTEPCVPGVDTLIDRSWAGLHDVQDLAGRAWGPGGFSPTLPATDSAVQHLVQARPAFRDAVGYDGVRPVNVMLGVRFLVEESRRWAKQVEAALRR